MFQNFPTCFSQKCTGKQRKQAQFRPKNIPTSENQLSGDVFFDSCAIVQAADANANTFPRGKRKVMFAYLRTGARTNDRRKDINHIKMHMNIFRRNEAAFLGPFFIRSYTASEQRLRRDYGAPLFRVCRICRTQTGECAYVQIMYFPAEIVRYSWIRINLIYSPLSRR